MPPRSHEGRVSLPASREGSCPSCFCSGYSDQVPFQQAGLQRSRSFVICRQTQLHFQLFTLKSFQIPGVLCRQLRGPEPLAASPGPHVWKLGEEGWWHRQGACRSDPGSSCSPGVLGAPRSTVCRMGLFKDSSRREEGILFYSHHVRATDPSGWGP